MFNAWAIPDHSWVKQLQEQLLMEPQHLNLDKYRCVKTGNFVHKWKKYVGFIESYEYCEDCDEKRKNE